METNVAALKKKFKKREIKVKAEFGKVLRDSSWTGGAEPLPSPDSISIQSRWRHFAERTCLTWRKNGNLDKTEVRLQLERLNLTPVSKSVLLRVAGLKAGLYFLPPEGERGPVVRLTSHWLRLIPDVIVSKCSSQMIQFETQDYFHVLLIILHSDCRQQSESTDLPQGIADPPRYPISPKCVISTVV